MGQSAGPVAVEPLIELGEMAAADPAADPTADPAAGRVADPVRLPRWLALAFVTLVAVTCLFADTAAVTPRVVVTVPTTRGDFELVDDVLYVFDGSYPLNRVAAYSLQDGRRLWRMRAPTGSRFETETENVSRVGPRTLIAPDPCTAAQPVETIALDTRSGREVWRRPGVPQIPVAGGELMIISRPGPTYGCGAGYTPSDALPVYWDAIDVVTGAVVWSTKVPSLPRTAFGSFDRQGARGAVFVTSDGTATSWDLRTGAVTSQVMLPELASPKRADPPSGSAVGLPSGSSVYFPQLTVAGDQVLAVRRVSSGPSIVVDVTAYDLDTLQWRWTRRVDVGPVDSRTGYLNVSACGPMLCLYGPPQTVLLDPRDGAERWRTTLKPIMTDGDWVLFTDQAGDPSLSTGLTIRNVRTGKLYRDLAGWGGFTGPRGSLGIPVLGFASRGRTWFARLDLNRARLTPPAGVPGFYYSCVAAEEFVACRRIDGTVRVWRYPS
jgi:outer membrane protein assembly factor BamB